MTNPKISVIVPIYNIEEYLEDALDCLVKQSFIEEMEILMIDDGSTDNSRYIIEKYALDYENFHAYHKVNEGPTVARNYAIDLAKGEYITFFDGDDHINRDGYEKLYKMAKRNDSDITIANSIRLRRYNLVDSIFFKRSFRNIDEDIDCTSIAESPDLLWDLFLWNKLFKRELILDNDIRFIDRKCYYADAPFTLKAYAYADKISVSKDIFYYWRYRENKNLSITQNSSKISNFYDRITIINLCYDVIETGRLNESLIEDLYSKILNHDLHVHFKKFYQYDEEYYPDIIDHVNEIIGVIPEEIKENLNSFRRIIYRMVENRDFDGLERFSQLYTELMKNPHVPDWLDEEYVKYIDFERDAMDEELAVKKEAISHDDDNVYISFKESINYLNEDYEHESRAKLVDADGNEFELEFRDSDLDSADDLDAKDDSKIKEKALKEIIIPIDLIKDKEHMRIKVEYIAEKFKKEAFIRNTKREVMRLDGFDIEIGIGINRTLYLDIRATNDLEIKITDVRFDDITLEFDGYCEEEINEICIENVITFEKIRFPVIKDVEEGRFSFSIPYEEILERPIRKWELKSEKTFKNIRLDKNFEFYTLKNKIRVLNTRNKILISDDFYSYNKTLEEDYDEIAHLKEERKELNKAKKELEKEYKKLEDKYKELDKKEKELEKKNKKLEKRIDEYKNRFAVKTTDKIKKML